MVIKYPKSKQHVAKLIKIIKSLLPLNGKGFRLVFKLFSTGQTLSAMIGYITKDSGKEHYQIRLHKISPEDLNNGRREHEALATAFDEKKIVITHKNMFNESFRFIKRCLFPLVVPPEFALLYMIQSGNYIFAADFITNFKKIDHNDTVKMWQMCFDPESTTLDDIYSLVYNPLSYGPKVALLSPIFLLCSLHYLTYMCLGYSLLV